MKTIQETALSEYGLTPTQLLTGEEIEFDAENKVNARKNQYVLYDFAKHLVNACTSDLVAAYRAVENLEAQNQELEIQVEEATHAANTSSDQVRKVLSKDKEFLAAERMLAKVEKQLDTFVKEKQTDQELITKLRGQVSDLKGQVSELNHLRETVPKLEADVNQVLEDLRSYMEDEGIPIDDLGETDL